MFGLGLPELMIVIIVVLISLCVLKIFSKKDISFGWLTNRFLDFIGVLIPWAAGTLLATLITDGRIFRYEIFAIGSLVGFFSSAVSGYFLGKLFALLSYKRHKRMMESIGVEVHDNK